MGTTLTGTTPQDTYDSLIKVTDNGPLSGTAKYLSDGLGNDSKLALSTGNIGIGTTSPAALLTLQDGNVDNVSGSKLRMVMGPNPYWEIQANNGGVAADRKLVFNTSASAGNVLTLTQAGNVGIGTTSPAATLEVKGGTSGFRSITSDATSATFSMLTDLGLGYDNAAQLIAGQSSSNNAHLILATKTSGSITEKVRILASGGITFNGDTAAANALDDYEEGTFTAVLNPATSGSFTLNSTFNTWGYTKIGRQVTIKGLALISSVASPVGTEVYISGLPFTILNSNTARGSAAVTYLDQSAGTWSAVPSKHSINNTFLDIQIDASTIAANDEFYVALTYFTA
jgi:hypothetical protein